MCNTIIAQPLPAVTIRNPLTNLPTAPDRAPARSNDIIKALEILETGHMEFCLDGVQQPVMARYESRSRGREGKEYWISSEGCDCKWGRERDRFGLGHSCKHYVAFRLAQFSMTQASDYVHCERVARAFEFTVNEQLMMLAKLLRMSARLVQDIRGGGMAQDTGFPMPEGFPCQLCGSHLGRETCVYCKEQYKFYRIAALVKLCDCGNKALDKLDCCKACEKKFVESQKPAKLTPTVSVDPFGDIEEMGRKIEARREQRKKPEPSQAQQQFQQEVDEFFSVTESSFEDDVNLLFDSSAPPSKSVKSAHIVNTERETSPTVRRRHSRYRK